jgi:hypothetical protein
LIDKLLNQQVVEVPNQQTEDQQVNNQQIVNLQADNQPADNQPADKLDYPSTDEEIIYPSTEPILAKKAVEQSAEKALPVRSEQLEAIAREADRHTRHGFELAGRGAFFAARSEFIAALRLVAQGLDTDGQTKSRQVVGGCLTALKRRKISFQTAPAGSRPGSSRHHNRPWYSGAEDAVKLALLR